MVLTPIFRLEQDEKKLKVIIHAPLAKISEMEVCVEEQTFYFDSSPYYLKYGLNCFSLMYLDSIFQVLY